MRPWLQPLALRALALVARTLAKPQKRKPQLIKPQLIKPQLIKPQLIKPQHARAPLQVSLFDRRERRELFAWVRVEIEMDRHEQKIPKKSNI
jgi:hypothetical protein